MHKIDGAGHVNGAWVSENLSQVPPRPPTEITPDWMNAVQDEIIAPIQAAGLAPSKVDSSQLLKAIGLLGGRVVDSIAAIRALPAGFSASVFATGYYAKGDGGGGAYWLDLTDTVSADDGGAIIVSAAGQRWKLMDVAGVTTAQFGASQANGASNVTARLLAFFAYCIANTRPGHIVKSDYLINSNQLIFDCGFVDKAWPHITTDGHQLVRFLRADDTDAPLLVLRNGDADGGVFKGWIGGALGGIKFVQNGFAKARGQHGLMLRGLYGTQIGFMAGTGLGGDTVRIERKLYGGTNPDPYQVALVEIDGAEGTWNDGASFWNDNYVGWCGSTIKVLRAIENKEGGYHGYGAGNTVLSVSMGQCAGWAFGEPTDNVGGSSTRFTVGIGEVDGCEFGIDKRRVSNSDFGRVRFVHRKNFGSLNPAGGYWPRIAVKCSADVPSAGNTMQIIDRIEASAGAVKADLGQFFDFGNAGSQLTDLRVRRQVLDNAGFGIVPADLYTNFNSNSKVLYTAGDGSPIVDTLNKSVALLRALTSSTIPNGGWTSVGNTVQFTTVLHDPSGATVAADAAYVVRSPGDYTLTARVVMALPVGTRVRLAFMSGTSAFFSRILYSTNAAAQSYEIDAQMFLNAGEKITVNADQNSGGAVSLSVMTLVNENQFSVTQI